jgi:predicted ester cyclase
MSAQNKDLVRRYYEAAMTDLSQMDEIVTEDYVDHHFPPDVPPGPDGVRQFFTTVLGSVYSDMRIEIDDMIAEDDKVACYFALLARHTGEFAGIEPQGNEIRCPAVSTFRVAGGKLAEGWEIFDSGDLLQQMRA